MRKITQTQTDSGVWVADSTISTDLERVGLLTRLDMTCEITPSATFDGANQPHSIKRLIQNMRVIGGAHTYFNLPADDGCGGGILLAYMGLKDGHGVGHEGGDVAAPSASYVPMNWTFHAGSVPRIRPDLDNPFDLSAFVPAGQEGQLRAEWTTSGNDVADDTVTIASAIMRFTNHRVIGTQAEIMQEIAMQGVQFPGGATGMVPAWKLSTLISISQPTTVAEAEYS